MYKNVGTKIKKLAVVIFILESIVGIISGLSIIGYDDKMIPVSLLLLFGIPFIAWISSWILYGFGELIEKACEIERNTRGVNKQPESQTNANLERINRIEELRSQGLISEEDYQNAIKVLKQ